MSESNGCQTGNYVQQRPNFPEWLESCQNRTEPLPAALGTMLSPSPSLCHTTRFGFSSGSFSDLIIITHRFCSALSSSAAHPLTYLLILRSSSAAPLLLHLLCWLPGFGRCLLAPPGVASVVLGITSSRTSQILVFTLHRFKTVVLLVLWEQEGSAVRRSPPMMYK